MAWAWLGGILGKVAMPTYYGLMYTGAQGHDGDIGSVRDEPFEGLYTPPRRTGGLAGHGWSSSSGERGSAMETGRDKEGHVWPKAN